MRGRKPVDPVQRTSDEEHKRLLAAKREAQKLYPEGHPIRVAAENAARRSQKTRRFTSGISDQEVLVSDELVGRVVRASLQSWQVYQLMLLIAKQVPYSEIAERYKITVNDVRQYADELQFEIAAIADSEPEEVEPSPVPGLWIADQRNRIAAQQGIIERIEEYFAKLKILNERNGTAYFPAMLVKVEAEIFHNIAEELGQIPDKETIRELAIKRMQGDPAKCVVIGISNEELGKLS